MLQSRTVRVHDIDVLVFFFNDTATTEIYTLSLHDALPISPQQTAYWQGVLRKATFAAEWKDDLEKNYWANVFVAGEERSEEHTSELQSRQYLVCRLLLEKKKIIMKTGSLILIHLDCHTIHS